MQINNRQFQAVKWSHDVLDACIEQRKSGQFDRFIVKNTLGERLSVGGLWGYEPAPSSRTDEYVKSHTFASFDGAVKAINTMILQLN